MAAKKCLICNCVFSGRRDAKTCSPRCRKRLQLVKLSFAAPQVRHQLTKTLPALIVGLFGTLSILLGLLSQPAVAATSDNLNFQSRLLTSTGAVVPDGNYHIEFKIYDTVSSGASAQGVCSLNSSTDDCWWVETRTTGNLVRVVNGYFSVNLGSVTAFGASIPWDQPLWLTMNIGGTSGPSWDGEMLASGNRIKLTGVPYAFRAGSLAKNNGTQTGTLSFNTVANSPVITLPDATGTVCLQGAAACGFATGTAASYIQNGTSLQTAANFNIQSAATGSIGAVIRGASGQTADLFQLQHGTSGAFVFKVDEDGNTTIQTQNNSNAAFQVLGSSGASALVVDTANDLGRVGIGNAASLPSAILHVATDQISTDLFLVTDATGTDVDVFKVANEGAATFRNRTDSTSAFQVQNAAGSSLTTADTKNAQVTISNSGGTSYNDQFATGGPTADPKWTFYAPDASTYSVNTAVAGKLQLQPLNPTGSYDCWTSGANCIRLMQTAPTGNFQAEMKIDTLPPGTSTAAGIIVMKDTTNFIRFERSSGGIKAHKVIGGVGATDLATCNTVANPVYLRVTRVADTWSMYYSLAGVNYLSCGSSFSQALDLSTGGSEVGVMMNKNTTSWSSVDIDYFQVDYPALVVNGGSLIKATSSGNLLDAQDSFGNSILNLRQYDSEWNLLATAKATFRNTNDSTSGFQVQNAAGSSLLSVDTTNSLITVSNGASLLQTTVGAKYLGGADAWGATNSDTGNLNYNSIATVGRYTYTVSVGSATACQGTPTNGLGCELQVYDVSVPGSPTYIGGADATGTTNGGTGTSIFNSIFVSGHYAYITKENSATACSQTAGSAIGCEFQVYDISNPALPTYVGGADVSGSTNSGTGNEIAQRVYVAGNYAYVTKSGDSTACSQTAGSAIGCELQVYRITNPAAPTYVGGADSSGSSNSGTGVDALISVYVSGRYAYLAKAGNATTCSGTAGSAVGCEMQIYDIANPATPAYVAGIDASGSTNSGTGNSQFREVSVSGRYAYVAKDGSATTCSATAGSGIGCELQVYNIANPAAPVYAGGADASGSTNSGTGNSTFDSVSLAGRYAYATKDGNATACSGTVGSAIGCELQIYDLSTPASPAYIGGADASGSTNTGSGNSTLEESFVSGRYIYVVKDGSATACSATPGSAIGCELQIYDLSGADLTSLNAGSLETGVLQVRTDALISNNLGVGGSLSVGQGALISNGLSVSGDTSIRSNTNSTTALQVQNSTGGNLFQVDSLNSNITINGNNTGIVQAWQTGNNSGLTARDTYVSVFANGYVYVIGGAGTGGSNLSTVQYATVNANGDVGNWSSTTSIPAARVNASGAVANGYIYVTGGSVDNTHAGATDTVYYGKINKDGTITSWTTSANPINVSGSKKRWQHSTVAYNGYLYVIGGADDAGNSNTTVYYSKLNPDGSNGTWAATNILANASRGISGVVANGYVYVTGRGSTHVEYAKLNADGTSSTWAAATALPVLRQFGGMGIANGYLYVVGGSNGSTTYYANTYFAPLNANGTIGSWSCQGSVGDCTGTTPVNSTALPATRSAISNTNIIHNGYVYVIGGWNGSTQATVYYSSTARVQLNGSLDLVGNSGENLTEGNSGGSLTAGNTSIVGTLNVQAATALNGSLSVLGALTVNNDAAFKNSTNSATAFQVQNAAAVNLFSVDTSGSIITLSGTTTTFATITLTEAHFKSTQTTAPTIGTPTNCATTPTATVTTGSTDLAGSFIITTGTGGGQTTCDTVITFNKAYGAAPKTIVLQPTTAVGSATGLKGIQVSASSTTTFTVKLTTAPGGAGEVNGFYYWVVE